MSLPESVPTSYTPHGCLLRQLRQADVSDGIYAVVVPVLRLRCHISVSVLIPFVASQVA